MEKKKIVKINGQEENVLKKNKLEHEEDESVEYVILPFGGPIPSFIILGALSLMLLIGILKNLFKVVYCNFINPNSCSVSPFMSNSVELVVMIILFMIIFSNFLAIMKLDPINRLIYVFKNFLAKSIKTR